MADNDVLFSEDFSGENPAISGNPPIFRGPYKVRLTAPEVKPNSSGNPRIAWTLEVVEDPSGRGQEGSTILDGQNVPMGEKAHIGRRFWLTTLASLGHDIKKFQRKFTLTTKDLQNREGFVSFTPKEETATGYSEVKWLLPQQYESQARGIAAQAAQGKLQPKSNDTAPEVSLPETTTVSTAVGEEDLMGI